MTIENMLQTLHSPAPDVTRLGPLLAVGLVEGYALFDSPVGEVAVTFNPHGVSAVDLVQAGFEAKLELRLGHPVAAAQPPDGWAERIIRGIQRGTPGNLPIDLRGLTPFQREVLGVAATIPSGEVRPYGWLAAQVGNPGAVRAVGSVMARNPVPLIVPCHRVVRSDGRIGNYSLGGPDQKWLLLDTEGARPDELEGLASRGVRFVGSNTTRVYCHPTCRHARRITHRHRVELRSSEEANSAGFRQCLVCRPQ